MREIIIKKDAVYQGQPLTSERRKKAGADLRLLCAPEKIKITYEEDIDNQIIETKVKL